MDHDTVTAYTFGKDDTATGEAKLFWLKTDRIVAVATGDEHSAAVTKKGRLFMMGANGWGQLGLGHKNSMERPTFVKDLRGIPVRKAACGRSFTVALTEKGQLYACGENGEGQLGLGHTGETLRPQPIALPDNVGAIRMVSCGSEHTALVTENGKLFTWGSNLDGQLGLETSTEGATSPTCVELPFSVKSASCGYYHTAVISDSGDLYTCGECDNDQLGHDEGSFAFHRVTTVGGDGALSCVACGNGHTAVCTEDGQLLVFGDGTAGQLGLGSDLVDNMLVSKPRLVTSLSAQRVVAVSCGDRHTGALSDTGDLFVFGDGRGGKFGAEDGKAVETAFRPRLIPALAEKQVLSVSCGGCQTMVLTQPRSEPEQSRIADTLLISAEPSSISVTKITDATVTDSTATASLRGGGDISNGPAAPASSAATVGTLTSDSENGKTGGDGPSPMSSHPSHEAQEHCSKCNNEPHATATVGGGSTEPAREIGEDLGGTTSRVSIYSDTGNGEHPGQGTADGDDLTLVSEFPDDELGGALNGHERESVSSRLSTSDEESGTGGQSAPSQPELDVDRTPTHSENGYDESTDTSPAQSAENQSDPNPSNISAEDNMIADLRNHKLFRRGETHTDACNKAEHTIEGGNDKTGDTSQNTTDGGEPKPVSNGTSNSEADPQRPSNVDTVHTAVDGATATAPPAAPDKSPVAKFPPTLPTKVPSSGTDPVQSPSKVSKFMFWKKQPQENPAQTPSPSSAPQQTRRRQSSSAACIIL